MTLNLCPITQYIKIHKKPNIYVKVHPCNIYKYIQNKFRPIIQVYLNEFKFL